MEEVDFCSRKFKWQHVLSLVNTIACCQRLYTYRVVNGLSDTEIKSDIKDMGKQHQNKNSVRRLSFHSHYPRSQSDSHMSRREHVWYPIEVARRDRIA